MMTLNGWQRLWLLASVLWAVAILALAGGGGWTTQSTLHMVRLWLVPAAAVYLFGVGLSWVMRGFQTEAK